MLMLKGDRNAYYHIVMLLMLLFFSGKTIPNGTDKHQLGTPENEGKFHSCFQFAGFLTWL